jgi:pyruvate formate-lyase activating enzyme-like uncharacterized protein
MIKFCPSFSQTVDQIDQFWNIEELKLSELNSNGLKTSESTDGSKSVSESGAKGADPSGYSDYSIGDCTGSCKRKFVQKIVKGTVKVKGLV